RLTPTGAIADDADPAVEVRQGLEIVDGSLDVAHGAIVRHASRGADARAILLGRRLRLTEVQVGADGHVPVVRESPGDLLRRPVPAGHMVDHDDAGVGTGSEGPRQVGVDLVASVTTHQNGFGEQGFVGHALAPFSRWWDGMRTIAD